MALAARGAREEEGQSRDVKDADLVKALRSVAGRIQVQAVLGALVLTALVWFCPA